MEGVFKSRYFSSEKEGGGGISSIRPFLMVVLTPRPNVKRPDVPAVFVAAGPYRSLYLQQRI